MNSPCVSHVFHTVPSLFDRKNFELLFNTWLSLWEGMATDQIKEILKKTTVFNLERFTLDGIEGPAKVVSIYDGDTCDVVFYHEEFNAFLRVKCRLLGFNAPELDEPYGKEIRNYLAHLCMGRLHNSFDNDVWDKKTLQDKLSENQNLVYAKFGKEEKYGRALVTLRRGPTGMNINEMVEDYIKAITI